jgi:sugar lactone lactonase YvrE
LSFPSALESAMIAAPYGEAASETRTSGGAMSRTWKIAVGIALGATAATVAIGSAIGGDRPGTPPADATWTTVLNSTLPIEGLTGDDDGYLYVAARGGAAGCPVWRVSATGQANQAPVTVAHVPGPCNASGLTFGPDGRLYITGAGAAGDAIAVVAPNAAAPPEATIFATGMPGANGLAFDAQGNLWGSDGGQNQGRVYRVGPAGGAATIAFRVPPMTNSVGVGRQNSATQPAPAVPAPQNIVANGLAFTHDGSLLVADTARGALWRVYLGRNGEVESPVGCDSTFTADTLCFDDVFVQHPFLDGADGIALDRAGNVFVDPNERNAIVVVDGRGRVSEFFRNPVGAGSLRNGGPLEFPTSPFLTGRTLCTTSSDGNRRDNSPNTAGEAVRGKISCLDERLQVPGEPLPVR